VIVWFGLLLLAFGNAALREDVLVPHLSDSASHGVSSVTLALAILIAAWYATAWVGPQSRQEAWLVGSIWLALTLAFEFLAGRYLFGRSWAVLLADYDVFAGRLWVVVLAATVASPVLTFIWHTAATGRP
jgi:hypothetical protein